MKRNQRNRASRRRHQPRGAQETQQPTMPDGFATMLRLFQAMANPGVDLPHIMTDAEEKQLLDARNQMIAQFEASNPTAVDRAEFERARTMGMRDALRQVDQTLDMPQGAQAAAMSSFFQGSLAHASAAATAAFPPPGETSFPNLIPPTVQDALERYTTNNPAAKKIVRNWLSQPHALNAVNIAGRNAVQIAACAGNLSLAQYLLEKNPSLVRKLDHAHDNLLMSVVRSACVGPAVAAASQPIRQKHLEIIRWLFSINAPINNDFAAAPRSALSYAVESGDLDMLTFLVETGRLDVARENPPLVTLIQDQTPNRTEILAYLQQQPSEAAAAAAHVPASHP